MIFSFLSGILFGIIYDFFRIRRIAFRIPSLFPKTKKRKITSLFLANLSVIDTVLIFFEDIVFSLFCTFVFILLNFKLYFGLPRWYSVAAAAVGFFLHHFTVGKVVIRSAEKIIKFTVISLKFVLNHTLVPVFKILERLIYAVNRYSNRNLNKRYTKKYEDRIIKFITDFRV